MARADFCGISLTVPASFAGTAWIAPAICNPHPYSVVSTTHSNPYLARFTHGTGSTLRPTRPGQFQNPCKWPLAKLDRRSHVASVDAHARPTVYMSPREREERERKRDEPGRRARAWSEGCRWPRCPWSRTPAHLDSLLHTNTCTTRLLSIPHSSR
jgi:hypothetical protein